VVYQKWLFHERYDIGPNKEAGVLLILFNNPSPHFFGKQGRMRG